MKKLLIVDDDDYFRAAVVKILSKKFKIQEANNGKVARELIAIGDIDLVISDIQMPYFSGLDLLEWSGKNKPTPFIIMTAFCSSEDRQRAEEFGVKDILLKPFGEEELVRKIQAVFPEKSEAPKVPSLKPPVELDREFCKLPIEDFIGDKETEYEIFIRVSASKYIKIVHKGAKLSEDKISVFKEKGLTHLYIRQEDFTKLVGFTVLVSKAVSSSGQVESVKKKRFLKYTGEMIMQQAYVQGTDEAVFRNAKDFLTTSMEVLSEDQETFALLNLLSNHTDYLYAHSLGVSVFSVIIAKQLGWQSPQTLFKLSFAGLFHDIGKKEIATEILEKPRSTLTQQERALLETHSTRGMEILQSLKTAPTEVIQVAYEHHEDILGQGYPQRLEKSALHPFSLIVAVADIFCEYTIRGPQNQAPRTGPEALQAMKTFKLAAIDAQAFQALSKAVTVA